MRISVILRQISEKREQGLRFKYIQRSDGFNYVQKKRRLRYRKKFRSVANLIYLSDIKFLASTITEILR